MFDMSWGEVMVIGAVALIVIGPKDLPKALRTLGNMTAKVRRMAAEFQGQFNEAMREAELDEVKKQIQGVNDSVGALNTGFNPIQTIRDELKGADRAPPGREKTPAETARRPPAPRAGGEPAAPGRAAIAAAGALRAAAGDPAESVASAEDEAAARRSAGGTRSSRPRAGREGVMTTEVEDEVEASRAPLIEHLIELRSRLIKALIAFVVMFFVCFAVAKYIYNILVWPYVGPSARPRRRTLVYTHALEFLFTQIQVAVFGAGFLAFPGDREPDLQVRRAGPLQERAPGLPALPRRDARAVHARRAGRLLHRHAAPDAVLGRHAAARHRRGRPRDPVPAQGQRVPVADHDADLRLRDLLPAAGHPDPPGAGRDHRSAVPQGEAPLRDRDRVRGRGGADAAGRDQPVRPCDPHPASLRGLHLLRPHGREEARGAEAARAAAE